MITNESEIRVALQAMLMCALAFWGFWSCAVVLFILLVPWRTVLGGELVPSKAHRGLAAAQSP